MKAVVMAGGFGMNITYIIPDNDYGTAGTVKLAETYFGLKLNLANNG